MKILVLVAALLAAAPAAAQVEVRSPDGRNLIRLAIDAQSRPAYSVSRDGAELLAPSGIVLELDRHRIGYGVAITASEQSSGDTRYPIVLGTAAEGHDRFNQAIVHLAETAGARRQMDVVIRAYDDGVAFRTILPVQDATAGASIRSEQTEFRFPSAHKCWGFNVGHFGSSHEGEYDPIDTARLREHHWYDLPVLCETGRAAFALTEADLTDYAGMYLTGRGDGGLGFATRLSPLPGNDRVKVRTRIGTPIRTPWRVIMLADNAGKLTESTLIGDLSRPSKVADTSWIRPGKAAWDWWNGSVVNGASPPAIDTQTAKGFIDFAAANGLEWSLVDDGWYVGSGQAPTVLPGTDVTRPTDRFDLAEVVRYAKARKVGIWLWVHWAALDPQMEEALTYYERMGVAGIKVDFMDRDDQPMVDWYEKLFAAAARHKLMVNLHGAFVPRGLNRTWPNFVTQEGVLGAEYNKWSNRITAEHNVMLAYTRALLGPMDYTPGGFRNVSPEAFQPRNALPFVQTTRAHGLAMYVVYPSPFATVADSPDTYAADAAGLDFIREVPTHWDETRFLAGEVGEFIVIARRKGRSWYIGALNNGTPRQVEVPLSSLGENSWDATFWNDGAAPHSLSTARRRLRSGEMLKLDLGPSGGAAIILAPRP